MQDDLPFARRQLRDRPHVGEIGEAPYRAHQRIARRRQRAAAHPAPEQRAVCARHDALVHVAVGLAQRLHADVADAQKFLEGRVEDGEALVDQRRAVEAEHPREGRVAGADHAVLGQHEADRRHLVGEPVEFALGSCVVHSYFHGIAVRRPAVR